jgi:hypothetical protein
MVYTDLPDMDSIWQVNICMVPNQLEQFGVTTLSGKAVSLKAHQTDIFVEQGVLCRLAVGNLPGALMFALATAQCTRPPLTAATAGKFAA